MSEYELPYTVSGPPAPPEVEDDNLPVNVIEKPIKVVMKRIYCKKCGAELVSCGAAGLSNPFHYHYRCKGCGNDYISLTKYPAICFVESEESDND